MAKKKVAKGGVSARGGQKLPHRSTGKPPGRPKGGTSEAARTMGVSRYPHDLITRRLLSACGAATKQADPGGDHQPKADKRHDQPIGFQAHGSRAAMAASAASMASSFASILVSRPP
jgi:hypothetical protein